MALPETYRLLETIVSAMDRNVYIVSVAQVGSTNVYTVRTNNTKWLVPGRTYTIGSENYKVVDIAPNYSFNIELQQGQTAPTAASFTIPAAFFDKGTFMFVNQERSQQLLTGENSPVVYFNEPSRETEFGEMDAREREAQCDLYFMIRADFSNWSNDKHYKYAIEAAGNMKKEFITAAKNQSFVGELEDVNPSSENHVKWGVYSDGKGHVRNYFAENLSGKKYEITIPFLRGCEGDCCENPYNPDPTSGSVIVENSDQSYQVEVDAGETLVLPDETFIFQINGVQVAQETVPALADETFEINWVA
jgi:hypothetical protein